MSTTKYDRNWNTIGHISDDGKTLYDNHWNVTGHVGEDGKTIYDKLWKVIGHVSDDGKTIYDKNWNVIGHTSDDGKTIYDKNWNVTERSETSNRRILINSRPTSYRSSSTEGSWVGWLIGALIVIAIVYFIFVVIIPLLILNIPVIALASSFFMKQKRKILLWSSTVGMAYVFLDTQVHWLSFHLMNNIEMSREVIDYIFYVNVTVGLTSSFLLLHPFINSNNQSTEASPDSAAGMKNKEATKRLIFVITGLLLAAITMVWIYRGPVTSPGVSTYSIPSYVSTEPAGSPPPVNTKLYTFRGTFIDVSFGDLYHIIFIDDKNQEWDFGPASNNNNLGEYTLDINNEGNPQYKGKKFLVMYDSIWTKVFEGETDPRGYMETVPRIVKLTIIE
ncbi:MAG: hypothetical protein EPO24_05165 [Bacteroidetes bacterium]|nr:MAG: hypothetical protein EPO24_05165 [Bacteroidota bacterium]